MEDADLENHLDADTAVAKFQNKIFQQMLEEKKHADPEWKGYVSVAKRNKAIRKEFMKDMDELLKWAGIGEVGEKELL